MDGIPCPFCGKRIDHWDFEIITPDMCQHDLYDLVNGINALRAERNLLEEKLKSILESLRIIRISTNINYAHKLADQAIAALDKKEG
jgi:hypothetical protein